MTTELLSSAANTVIVSLNPNSGASNQEALAEQLCAELTQRGYQTKMLTVIAEVKRNVAELLAANQLRAVVAAGGDGTVSLLANELPPATPLVILPLGTENLLAKFLKQTADPTAIAELIDAGQTVRLDAGRANGKLFLVMASCGFDAEVVSRLHAGRRGHIQHWSYARPILGAIWQYHYPRLQLWIDDASEPIEGRWAFVFNVPRYAMNLPLVTDADARDGRLDLCTFRGGNLMRGLYYLATILAGGHRRWTSSHLQRFTRLRIESDSHEKPVPYQLDGDPGGVLPVEIEVLPKFIRVVVSNAWIDENTLR